MKNYSKLSLKCFDRVKVKNTGTHLDGQTFIVVGLASRNIIDTYILEIPEDGTDEMPDFGTYQSFCMHETLLERV